MAFTSYLVDNDRRFRSAIARAADLDLRAPFGLILADFYRSEQAIFALKGPGQYPDFTEKGKIVGPLSKYAQAKEKKVGFMYPLLMRTGSLAASLLSRDAPGAVALINPYSLVFGTTVKYGIYHQSDEPRKKIPLRKFLFIGPEAPRFANSDQAGRPERWFQILNDYVLKKMEQEGLASRG